MSYTPRLLDQLAQLTGMRDVELLEFSLLKTLNESTRPLQISLIRMNSGNQPVYLMRYQREGGHDVSTQKITLAPETQEVIALVKRIRKPHSRRCGDGGFLTAYPALEAQAFDIYLLVKTERQPSNEHKWLYGCLLQIYQNFCHLLDESQRDQLTGLPNRKTFEDSVNKILSLARPRRDFESEVPDLRPIDPDPATYWLGVIDIDRFKGINDTFGHLYGDEVLLLVSQIMQRHFRAEDLIFRYGGEEFVAIISGTGRAAAKTAFDRLRTSISGHHFPQVGQVTISVGVVQITHGTLTPTLLDMADRALYYAKQNGRDRVCLYEDLVESGGIEPRAVASGSVELF